MIIPVQFEVCNHPKKFSMVYFIQFKTSKWNMLIKFRHNIISKHNDMTFLMQNSSVPVYWFSITLKMDLSRLILIVAV